MQNQSKQVKPLDEQPKGRKGIKEMIDRMFETDDDGQPLCDINKAAKESA